jgi:hypothetical protein
MAKTKNNKGRAKGPEDQPWARRKLYTSDLEHVIPDDVKLLYSDSFLVQSNGPEYILLFFQLRRPIVFSEQDAERVGKVRADCVARIAVSPAQMDKILEHVQNVKTLLARQREQERGQK